MSAEAIIFAALLFGSAQTLAWPGAWVYLTIFFGWACLIAGRLLKENPDLLAERMKPLIQEGQPLWDKVILTLFAILFVVHLVIAGIYRHAHLSLFPAWIQVLGALGLGLSFWIVSLAFRANNFLANVVRNQEERGQEIVQNGPYSVVRHPMYAGAIWMFPTGGMLLGSVVSFEVGIFMSLLLLVRTELEDRELRAWLKGYTEYSRKVKYRLIPKVW